MPWTTLFAQLAEDRARVRAGLPQTAAADEAWKEIGRRLRVIALAARRGLPGDVYSDPDDLVQDILLRLQSPSELEHLLRVAHPSAYLYRVIRNASIDAARRSHRHHLLEESARYETEFLSNDVWQVDQIGTAIQLLPHASQLLLRWKFWDGYSTAEIAQRLGISYSAAAVRIHRALQKLREIASE